jgi:hypothetical protein
MIIKRDINVELTVMSVYQITVLLSRHVSVRIVTELAGQGNVTIGTKLATNIVPYHVSWYINVRPVRNSWNSGK